MNYSTLILIHIPKDPIDNKSELVEVTAQYQANETPLPEPMAIQFTDTYLGHQGSMNYGWSYVSLWTKLRI